MLTAPTNNPSARAESRSTRLIVLHCAPVARPAGLVGDPLMVPDDLRDDEREERLREFGIEARILRKSPQSSDLTGLTARVRGRQVPLGLESAGTLGELEPLRQHVDEH